MRELINIHDNRATIRWKLLTSASALALSAYVSSAGMAQAGDTDHPMFWIELGGQLSRLESSQQNLDPPFFADVDAVPGFDSPLKFETPPRYSIDEYGKLSFQPSESDWVFSASVRYGKSTNKNRVHQQTTPLPFQITHFPISTPPPFHYGTVTGTPTFGKFSDLQWSSTEKHTILDFQAGKDIGLGLFGHGGSSTIGFGVRFAQFFSKSSAEINAQPLGHYPTHPLSLFQFFFSGTVTGNLHWLHSYNERDFHGVGPTISWQGSAPIAGNADSSELAVDWGINAAVLFGRQKARGHHQSSNYQFVRFLGSVAAHAVPTHIGPYVTHDRSRNVTVPNVGGSLGISFRSGDAKVSFGYRADLFMGAMDTGIDTRKSSNMLFHGPYASISIGLGD